MGEEEGVVKFNLEHEFNPLTNVSIAPLNRWRTILRKLGLIGATPDRYDGFGFGNLSQRTERGFLITGSQTGDIEDLTFDHYAEVLQADSETNHVVSIGRIQPSSESLTHAAVYRAEPKIGAVFHVHCPVLWRKEQVSTPGHIRYGTPEMADAVTALINSESGVFSMLGHEDGVVSFGTDCEQAGLLLIKALTRA
ncbi:MAG: ribulose-5-phosphate 4-epimerase/fuculose-1-phosphate aldolase [Candidatus Azotimanducaceae bacterium]|jgi:L-ribulose-5-phosphate 4-epimerase